MDERKSSQKSRFDRRQWMKLSAVGGLGLSTTTPSLSGISLQRTDHDLGPPPNKPFAASPLDRVRIGFVGVGGMGSNHVKNLLRIKGAELRAVCDLDRVKVERIQAWTREAGQPQPKGFWRGETDFKRMCQQEDLDLVYTATPWRWHVPVCLAAMEAGKHAATEVPAALTIDECWQLVEAAEKYKKHCVMMENCNYGRRELMILNMLRKGLLGEIMHAECGYLHDLRAITFASESKGLWRRDHAIRRNGNLYPTHGLGPVAQCMDINRGDRFDYLVSMSSNSRGLYQYAQEHFSPESLERQEEYALGDVNVSLIHTVNGRTIFLSYDCNLPRPYSRINLVQGTKGIVHGYPDRVHIEGRSPQHQWEAASAYLEEFDHPLWKTLGKDSPGASHGGMDYLEDYRLIQCLREGSPTDMDVYDAAALSVVSELTEQSVSHKSRPVEFPDFTRGAWKVFPPLGIVQS